jgi:hypothetical protein
MAEVEVEIEEDLQRQDRIKIYINLVLFLRDPKE